MSHDRYTEITFTLVSTLSARGSASPPVTRPGEPISIAAAYINDCARIKKPFILYNRNVPFHIFVRSRSGRYFIISSNSASEITRTPSSFALRSLLPASSPASTMPVFLETLPLVLPPKRSMMAEASSRV